MDRPAFKLCANLLISLGTASLAGCGHSSPEIVPTQTDLTERPRLLDAPQAAAPIVRRLPESSQVLPVGYPRQPAPSGRAAMPPVIEMGTPFTASRGAGELVASPRKYLQSPAAAAVDPPQSLAADNESLRPLPPIGDESIGPIQADEAAPGAMTQPEASDSTSLPWAARRNSRAMKAVLAKTDEFVRRGFELGDRGALFSARAEFVGALRMLSGALDAETRTNAHSRALSAGLVALRESQSFIIRRGGEQGELDVSFLITAHTTPVLKAEVGTKISPLMALQRYYTYAQEQLAFAAGREMAGSMALFGLGKITSETHVAGKTEQLEIAAGAMVWHQAALLADPLNFRAANELGVLVAEAGDYERAKQLFLQSLSSSNQAAAWQNLAAVHQQLGESGLAAQATQRAVALGGTRVPYNSKAPVVRWVDSATFARSGPGPQSQVQRDGAKGDPNQSQAAQPTPRKRTATVPWNAPGSSLSTAFPSLPSKALRHRPK